MIKANGVKSISVLQSIDDPNMIIVTSELEYQETVKISRYDEIHVRMEEDVSYWQL